MIPLTNNSSSTSQKLQAFLSGAAAATNPTVTVGSYIVPNATKPNDFAEYRSSPQFTVLAGTAETDIADAPPSGQVKDIHYISIYNTDTASVTVTVCVDDNATNRILIKATLLTLETLFYEDGQGWYAVDANGNRKEVTSSLFSSITVTGAITETPRAASYQWSTWNPSDVAGTITNAPATAVATVTATNYMTMSNSSGTVTFTFTKAGNYLITLQSNDGNAAGYTDAVLRFTVGGTATRLMTPTQMDVGSAISGRDFGNARAFLVSATTNQTLTVLPSGSITLGGGTASNYTLSANATATYVGTT